MIEMLYFEQKECPAYLKQQIISLMRQVWPQAFEEKDEDVVWPDCPETQPTSLVFVKNKRVISHVGIPWKIIKHEGQTYKVFGLSEVMAHPAYRGQGYGIRLVKEAYKFIEKSHPDISLFTCESALVPFYRQGGWEHKPYLNLIGGTRTQPFRSDSLGLATMIHLFSEKALENRLSFEEADIYLDLGERKLW